jgi:topoisomerase-4 subunit A
VRLKTLVRKELEQDAKTYGDERRSPIVTREQAQELKETDRVPVEPITVVLSSMGWVRAAKGHEIQGADLSYKAGDSFLTQAATRSNEPVYFLDSTGRSYSLLGIALPSARGHGEPLSATLNPPAGALFVGMVTGEQSEKILLLSNAGYGFIATIEDLATKNRSGKTLLKVDSPAKALAPVLLTGKAVRLGLLTNEGRLLIIDSQELPNMSKGRGNKIMSIPHAKEGKDQEEIISVVAFAPADALSIQAGRRELTLTPKALDQYWGERGTRGQKLPKGYPNASQIVVIKKK